VDIKGFRLPTWDRFSIPLPFSEVKIILGKPIVVEEKNFELYKDLIEKELKGLKGEI